MASAASLFLVSLGVVGVAGPAQAAHVACGQTILVSTVLDSNIGPCGAGLVIGANNITLDLNGFTITGGPVGDGPGILLEDRTGVTVRNGTVTQFDAGVAIDGGSGNNVNNMRILDNRGNFSTDFGDGIAMFATSGNRITNNQVRNNGPYDGIGMIASSFNLIDSNQVTDNLQSSSNTAGIRVENLGRNASNDNVITNNLVANNALDGIEVFAGGSRNQIRFNQIFGNARDGITVFAGGSNNIIEGNQIRSNREDGIHIRGAAGTFPAPTGNQILRNVAFGNVVFDLRDDNPNCGGNQWHGNQAASFTPPCTMNP
ncbi:MAG TPA: right-handed parallel beta-helix repeat-containing protein [Acidimicrobiales bacterium]|nr:right-handed parallel beta-helix repeat-containing protein [Acidimicrobiales bacterium]